MARATSRCGSAQYFAQRAFLNFSHPCDPRTQLLFLRADVTDQTGLIDKMGKIFILLTTQEYVQYVTRVRFGLSRRRVERMRKESARWCMMAYQSDTGQEGECLQSTGVRVHVLTAFVAATLPVPINRWMLYDSGRV